MTNRPWRRRARQGFTLVETLIAGAILLILAIGVLPIFIRSLASNAQGGELTMKTGQAGSRIEEFLPMNVNNTKLAVTSGTQSLTYNAFTLGQPATAAVGSDTNRGWLTESTTPPTSWAPARGNALWRRETTIQNFNIQDLDTATLNYAGALPLAFPPAPVPSTAATSMKNTFFLTVRITNGTTRLADINGANDTRFIFVKTQ